MEKIKVLWTGGFDSTFVVCQLSLLPVEIQPIYISMGRNSEANELKAIQTISDFVNANEKKRCVGCATLIKLNNTYMKIGKSFRRKRITRLKQYNFFTL